MAKKAKKKGARRYEIERTPHHWVTRDKNGRFKKWTGKGKSLSKDVRQHAKTKVKSGYGHRGDLTYSHP